MPTNPTIAEEAVKHTPGPWNVNGEGFVVGGEGDAPNADFVSLRYITAPCVSRHHHPTDEELAANALIMAAAPDLLAAAKAALVYDAAMRHRGFIGKGLEPAPGLPGALATGVDLDALYWDWQEKSAAAVAKADGPK